MKIGIVAGEISGDNLGAGLIHAMKVKHPDAEFIGIGGPGMIEAGCQSLFPIEKLSVMGLVEILKHYRELHGIRAQLIAYFQNDPPDVFIGIDSPEFNLGLETRLKKFGIKTIQYVSPQVWAWREGRLPKIAKATDLILAILPFEEEYYKKHNIPARFIGHSKADEIPDQIAKQPIREKLGLPQDKTIIALMPGSRTKEWQHHVDVFLETAKLCTADRSDLHFLGVMVNQKAEDYFNEHLQRITPDLPITLIQKQSLDAIAASDLVLSVSGTAALEIMLSKRPMVIAYRTSKITFSIARRLVKLKYFSLPNLLSNEKLVPELLQDQVTAENLKKELFNWLDNPEKIASYEQKSQQIHDQLRCNASEQAAEAVLELCKS